MKHGFSLVELSIVLVILGLLTGGILTGQTLIRAAELRAVTTEFQRYQSAVNTFRDKYFALPGDMRNAEDFWGTASSGTCPTASGTGTQTCDGDGDGNLSNVSNESFRFWQHMANAGLIEGTYTGVAGAAGVFDHVPAENVPASKLSRGGWGARSLNNFGGGSDLYARDYGNQFDFGNGGTGSIVGVAPNGRILTPEETWNIDTKLDDGLPGRGGVIVRNWDICTFSADEDDLDAAYNLALNSISCSIIFTNAF